MKTQLKLFTILVLLLSLQLQAQVIKYDLTDLESSKRIYHGIDVLASDSLMGREAGTIGEVRAAEYIAAEFQKTGLGKYIGDTSYFHYFNFKDGVTYEKGTYLILNNKKYKLNEDFFPLSVSSNGEVEGRIINAKDGIVDTAKGINQFANNKIEDPIFVVQIQDNGDDDYFLMKAAKKAKLAKEYGAKALIFINTNKELTNPSANFTNAMQLSEIPIIFADKAAVKVLLDATYPKVSLSVNIADDMKQGVNVVGGINNNAEQTIIIGAHYDHLGMGGRTSRYRGEPEIHNGADDNASGVLGVIELARYIKSKQELKKHNYIFIAFSAEEKGLIGSTRFANSELYDPSQVNCMLNMDMIGRMDSTTKKLYVMGTGTSPIWDSLLNNIPNPEQLDINGVASGMGGSDHTPFYLKDIPVLFFFTGMHQDYHTPTDDIEKLNFDGEVMVLNYVENLIAALNDMERLDFVKTSNASQGKTRYKGVTLGFMPDHAYNGAGVRINAVSDNKPAANAGLENGDIIMKIDDHEIKEIRSYMKALGNYKKGDVVKVTAQRDGEEIIKEVKF